MGMARFCGCYCGAGFSLSFQKQAEACTTKNGHTRRALPHHDRVEIIPCLEDPPMISRREMLAAIAASLPAVRGALSMAAQPDRPRLGIAITSLSIHWGASRLNRAGAHLKTPLDIVQYCHEIG